MKKVICLALLLTASTVFGAVYDVPGEYDTIQAAINVCQDLDTVVVAPGVYSGPGNCNINLKGKAITICSSDPDNSETVADTVIDCDGARGFVFYYGEGNDSVVSGFTITGGYGITGGAIRCFNGSSPSIRKCVITGNSATFGGAISVESSSSEPVIKNCRIVGNSAIVGGGGIYCNSGSIEIKNCVITDNTALLGTAVYSLNQSSVIVSGSTIRNNSASSLAGGVYCSSSSSLVLKHSILWGNTASDSAQLWAGAGSVADISYCDIQVGLPGIYVSDDSSINWGAGNIDIDPGFAADDNCHLSEDSGCVDAGAPDYVAEENETDIDGQLRVSGLAIDIGADEVKAAVRATVRITPRALNIKNLVSRLNCSIMLEEGYNVSDIDISSITLSGADTEAQRVDLEQDELIVRLFLATAKIQEIVTSGTDEVELKISGKLNGSQMTFAGADTIKIISSGSRQKKKSGR